MSNRKIIFISILLLCLFALQAVSASDNITDDAIGVDDASSDEINLNENTDEINSYDESEIIGEADNGTFTALQEKVSNAQSESTITLENNYTYDESFSHDLGIEIVDKRNITIDGKGFTIDADGKSCIFNVQNSTVVFKNIIFVNGYYRFGGAIHCIDSEYCIVSNCTFINNTAEATSTRSKSQGGAIYLLNTRGIIEGSTFIGNEVTAVEYMMTSGGAIYCDGANNTLISNCSFENNTAMDDGGAIYCHGSNYVVISNSSFVNNSARYGGAIIVVSGLCDDETLVGFNATVVECNFTDNSAVCDGGAIIWGSDNGTLSKSIFTNNFAITGAAVRWGYYFYENPDIGSFDIGFNGTVLECNFTDNNADSEGGAIYVYCANTTIIESNFTNNTAGYTGGAIYCEWEVYNLTVSNSRFINNTAYRYSGGAIYLGANNGSVSNCIFIFNNASYCGGAIDLEGDNGTVTESIFNNNSADYGGAVYLMGNNGTISNSVFTNNSANNDGGAIASMAIVEDEEMWGWNSAIFECNFTDNHADGYGGAVYWSSDNGTVSGCGFINNSAGYYGGAICWDANNGTVFNSTFNANNALFGGAVYWNYEEFEEGYIFGLNGAVLECNFTDNSADVNGGAIVWEGHNGTVSKSNFNANQAFENSCGGAILWLGDNGTVSQSNFDSNHASGGGAICLGFMTVTSDFKVVLGFNDTVLDCNFTNNSATYGGALLVLTENGIVLTSNFNNNYGVYGGAIYWDACNGTVSYSNFTGNSAWVEEGEGGAIYWNMVDNGTISNSRFINNYACYAGAISFNGDDGTVSDSIFNANYAELGGAIVWHGINGTVCNSAFDENNAFNGGAVYWKGDNGTISQSSFNDNSADYGGAIWWGYILDFSDFSYVLGCNGAVMECNFTNNSVDECGGAVYWLGDNGTVSRSNFNDNYADYGGAINWGNIAGLEDYQVPGCNGTVFECNFTNNSADYGGAVYWISDNGTVSRSSFNDNHASDGGAIFWGEISHSLDYIHVFGCNGTVFECNFTNNSAVHGGAVYWLGDNGTVSRSSFNDNYAGYGGAICWGDFAKESDILGDNGTVSDCSFTNNSADVGGAVYWKGMLATVLNSNFTNNKAYGGGAIYSQPLLTIFNSLFLNNKAGIMTFVGTGNLTFAFEGKEDYIHAVITSFGVIFSNVTYWNGSVVNSDDVAPVKSIYPGINITVEVYDSNAKLVDNVTLITNETSEVQYVFNLFNLDDGQYTVRAYHADDSYYYASGIAEDTFTLNRNSSSVEINIDDKAEFNCNDCNISFTVINRTQVRVVITDMKGLVLVNQTTDENFTFVTLNPDDDYYNITVYNEGTQFFAPSKDSKLFKINYLKCNVVVSADEVVYGFNTTINVTADVDGNYTLDINGRLINVTVVEGKGNVSLALPAGSYYANATYNNDNYTTNASNAVFKVLNVILDAKDANYGWSNSYQYQAKLVDEKGRPIPDVQLTFSINGKTYKGTTNSEGIVIVVLDSLNVGNYNILISNNLSGTSNKKINVLPRIESHDLVMDYDKGSFVIKVIGDDGNPAVNEIVKMTVNGVTYNVKTDNAGKAKLLIELKPKKYTITSNYKGYTVKNTIKVKFTLKAKKKFKVKKNKDLVLKAKLKWSNGKAIKGKKITFKFRGKKYFATTNKKGIAKVIISNEIIKDLKKKKYKVKISYKNETKICKVKIKK